MKHIVDILLKTRGIPDENAILNTCEDTVFNGDIVA